MKLAVYTCITGDYDDLLEPSSINKQFDFICFSDRPSDLKPWQFRQLPESALDDYLLAKHPKILPHLYLSEYDVSIWVDANIQVVGDLNILVDKYLADCDIAIFRHPERDCPLEEAAAIIRLGKDDPEKIKNQIEKYQGILAPKSGLHACGVLIRRHHSALIKKSMENWWREIVDGSKRDQISFQYVRKITQLDVATIDDNIRDNAFFRWQRHKHSLVKKKRKTEVASAECEKASSVDVISANAEKEAPSHHQPKRFSPLQFIKKLFY